MGGTIEKGKLADLVLLDANPLENISNAPDRAEYQDEVDDLYLVGRALSPWTKIARHASPVGAQPDPQLLPRTRDQNVSRNPICPVLVDATLVILPKLGCVTVRTGSLYCSQLNALNDSARTCSRASPRTVKDFAIARSTRRRPGPCTCEGFWVPGRTVARVIE